MTRNELQNLSPGQYVQQTFDVEAFTQCKVLKENPRWGQPQKVLRVHLFEDVNGGQCAQVEAASHTGNGTVTFTTSEDEVLWRLCEEEGPQPGAGLCPVCQERTLEGEQVYCSVSCAEAADTLRQAGGVHVNTTPVVFEPRHRVKDARNLQAVLAMAQTALREYRTPKPVCFVYAISTGYAHTSLRPLSTQNHYRVYANRVELWAPKFEEVASPQE